MTNSDIVQTISLPLECIGMMLTLTEVFGKKLNRTLEMIFIRFYKTIDGLWYKHNNQAAMIFAIVVIGSMAISIFSDAFPDIVSPPIGFLFFLVFWICMIGISIFDLYKTLLVEKPLLALGLTLSTIGLFGEIYQFSQIDF